MIMVPIKEALTFDDVTLVPKYSEILPSDVDTSIKLTTFLKLKIPILSSAMDTITESKMAIAIGKAGGIGIIHRNLDIQKQLLEIKKVKKHKILVGAAVGAGPKEFDRASAILKENVDMIVVDTAHGHTKKVAEIIRFIKKKKNKKTALCAGNVATAEAANFLRKLGVDIIKVGIGPGSICTTRVIAGIGVPQLTAIMDVSKITQKNNIPLIADGGIRYSGDIVKALVGGASTVMLGSIIAGVEESPGETIMYEGRRFKSYRGMGSIEAMEMGSKDRYFQSEELDNKKLVPEGIVGRVAYKGTLVEVIHQMIGGLRAGMGYTGSTSINDLSKAKFLKVTAAGVAESHPHDVTITREAPNYSRK